MYKKAIRAISQEQKRNERLERFRALPKNSEAEDQTKYIVDNVICKYYENHKYNADHDVFVAYIDLKDRAQTNVFGPFSHEDIKNEPISPEFIEYIDDFRHRPDVISFGPAFHLIVFYSDGEYNYVDCAAVRHQ